MFRIHVVDAALKSIIDVRPTFMRPPYGSTSPLARNTLTEDGYKIVNWDVDTGDSASTELCAGP